MSNTNTRPEQIIDKNGVLTTRHKSTEVKSSSGSAARVASLAPAATTGDIDASSVTKDSPLTHKLNDEVFSAVVIERNNDGALTATGAFTIDEDALEQLRHEVGNLGDYFDANSDDIKSYIKNEYGATNVTLDVDNESISVSYELPLESESVNSEILLDNLYDTRAVSLHENAYGSDKLSFGIEAFVSATDTEYVEPRGGRASFDDDI